MMNNSDTSETRFSSVTQVVYKAVFENNEMFREISKEQAEKRRAEEAARQEAVREKRVHQAKSQIEQPDGGQAFNTSPSVIIDIAGAEQSKLASSAPEQPAHSLNVLA